MAFGFFFTCFDRVEEDLDVLTAGSKSAVVLLMFVLKAFRVFSVRSWR